MNTELLLNRQEEGADQTRQMQCPEDCNFCTGPETD